MGEKEILMSLADSIIKLNGLIEKLADVIIAIDKRVDWLEGRE